MTAAIPWRTTMRERHVAAPRARAWEALLAQLGEDEGDLSVEPPWRHVRQVMVDGVDRAETTVAIRDDGAESHLAWCAGTTADDDEADRLLAGLADEAEGLLATVAEAAEAPR
jgi:hypothetical protein